MKSEKRKVKSLLMVTERVEVRLNYRVLQITKVSIMHGLLLKMKKILIVWIGFILFGILTIETTKAQNNMKEKSVKDEFIINEGLESLYKGKYAGTIKQDSLEFFHFQFDGVLKGNMRFLNIYFETNNDKEAEKKAFCNETNQAAQGSTAYLLFRLKDTGPDLNYKLKNQHTHTNQYDFSKLPQSPDIFFETAYAETESIGDTVFVVSLHTNDYSDWFTVELAMWFKNTDGSFSPERYKTIIDGNSELFEIKTGEFE